MRRRAHARCAGGALQSASLGCEPNFNQKKHKALEQILGGPWAVRVAWAHQSPSDPCCDSYMAPVRMTHKPSLSQSVFSTALPLFSARICAVLAKVTPMASACSLPAWEARSLGPQPSWRPGGCSRRQLMPQAAQSLGQPRPAAATQPQAAWMLLRPHRGRLGPPLPRPSSAQGGVCPRRRCLQSCPRERRPSCRQRRSAPAP